VQRCYGFGKHSFIRFIFEEMLRVLADSVTECDMDKDRLTELGESINMATTSTALPEWRNWYTHQTQNLARFTPHESSSLSSGTNKFWRKPVGRMRGRSPMPQCEFVAVGFDSARPNFVLSRLVSRRDLINSFDHGLHFGRVG